MRSVTDEKQRQLDTIHHIYDVEKLLFNAHENRENLSQALEKISGIIGAKRMMFWLCDGDTVRNVCLWKQTQDVKEQQSAARESIKDGKRESEGDGDGLSESAYWHILSGKRELFMRTVSQQSRSEIRRAKSAGSWRLRGQGIYRGETLPRQPC